MTDADKDIKAELLLFITTYITVFVLLQPPSITDFAFIKPISRGAFGYALTTYTYLTYFYYRELTLGFQLTLKCGLVGMQAVFFLNHKMHKLF